MFSQVSGCDGTAKSLSKRRRKVAEEVMSNDDLLLEVFLRLPAKPLTRFKCVSKQWLSLISDPKFGSKHTRLNPSLLTLGIYFNDKYNYRLQSVSLDQAHQKNLPSLAFINICWSSFCSDRPKIMHACNGLILYSYWGKFPYYVCNMTTRKTTVLPQHPLPSSKWYPNDYCAYLVTDPSKSPHFKVVLLNMTVSRHDTNFHYDDQYREKAAYCYGLCYEIDVYSSETGVWKRLFFRALHGSPLNFKAVCDGSLHWITKEKFHVRFEVDTLKLVSNPMPSKPKTIDVEKIRYFGECCGHLFLIHIPWHTAKPFHVYELDKDHSSWEMKCSVNLSLLMTAYPDSFQYLEPTKRRRLPTFGWKFFILCLVKEDDINGFSVMLAIPGKIVSYNLMKNTCKVLHEWPLKEFPLVNQYYFTETFPFVSTLFPV